MRFPQAAALLLRGSEALGLAKTASRDNCGCCRHADRTAISLACPRHLMVDRRSCSRPGVAGRAWGLHR